LSSVNATASALLDSPIVVAALILALLGGLLLSAGLHRLRRRRWLGAAGRLCGGGCLLALAGLAAAVAFNLYSYHRLSYEQDVATLHFRQLAPRHYVADLAAAGGAGRRYQLRGDAWQLDARVLKWRGAANLLGLDARYRLERLSGRYRDLGRERRATHTVHDLSNDRIIDLFALARGYPRWLPWLDATFGSAAYLPMADGAEYRVSLTQSGLVARPANEAARVAVQRWR
jgi:hypothetical protein